ncbi:MAG: hypothetical protein KIS84_14490 [Dokdonella sp.]|nr:hypothetical protein [Dokdonella sp.]
MKTIVGLLMLALSMPVYAQIARCLDKSGKVVAYGTDCPPGTRQEQTSIRNAPATSSPQSGASQPSLAERDAEFRKRQIEQQEAQAKQTKQAAEEQQKQSACDNARAYLKSLQSGMRITRTDPKTGERIFLEDKDYAGEIAKAQRSVDTNCK